MPCSDISEILKLRLNKDNRVGSYVLLKKSCGDEVGEENLILPWLEKYTADRPMVYVYLPAVSPGYVPLHRAEESPPPGPRQAQAGIA